MRLWEIMIIAIGLSLDVFAYNLWRGAMLSEVKSGFVIRMIAVFTGLQLFFLILGNCITRIPALAGHIHRADRLWTLIAALSFLAIGVYMILRARHQNKTEVIEERKQDEFQLKAVVIWALITSIDAFMAGLSFGFLGAALLEVAVMTAVTSAVAAILGIVLGYHLGCSPKNTLVTIGGIMVMIGGFDIFSHYLMWW